jgi:DNA-binding winged helix-turn-helix (wHTH) protein
MGAHREGDRLASGAAGADAVVWHFANIVFDEGAMELRVAGRTTDAEPKAMELLQLLLRRAGEVVTRQEILDAIWPGRIINDGGLTNCVSKLRAALGDHDQAVVRTVPRFGYRLMAEVHSLQVATRAMPTTSGTGLAVGDPVPGREDFHLERLLAEAGQAEVWLAHHHTAAASERRVYKFARSEQELTLLKREITLNRVLAESQNGPTGFVPLLSWNLERAPYFAELAYAAHGSLPDWLERRGGVDALSLAERLDIVTQCAVAMSAAHAVGVLHKDLKPANILVADENPLRIQLCDLGAGGLLDADTFAHSSITRYGFTRVLDISDDGGTPLYVAPEVLAGRPPTALSDIYALGVLLFQLVVGDLRRAFSPGWETQVDHPLLREDIAIAARGDPAQRFSDAGLLALRLRSLETRQADHEALLRQLAATEASRQNLLRRRAQRGLKLALAASMAFAVVSTMLLGWQWLSPRSAVAPSGDLAACRTGIAER